MIDENTADTGVVQRQQVENMKRCMSLPPYRNKIDCAGLDLKSIVDQLS